MAGKTGGNRTGREDISFEEALTRLETVVKKLESGELSLDDSLKHFQEGIRLSRVCREILAEVEYKVDYLLREEGFGEPEKSEEKEEEGAGGPCTD